MNHTLKKSLVFAVIFILLCSLVPLTLLLSSNKNNKLKRNEQNPANEEKLILGFSQIGSINYVELIFELI